MRPSSLTATFIALVTTTQAQLIPFLAKPSPNPAVAQQASHHGQNPMADPGIQLPPSDPSSPPSHGPPPNSDVILSDVIGTQRQIQIFAGFTRDISTVSSRLETSSLNTTVLAPLNSALTALPRKPWEDPREYAALGAEAYEGQDGEDRAHRNLRRFTEAHVVLGSPWKEGEKAETMSGSKIWWEKKGDKVVVQPGEVEVERVLSRVANGNVWALKGVLNYAA